VFIVLCTISIGSLVIVKYNFLQYPRAIIREQGILFAGPDKNYHELGEVRAAQSVRVKAKLGDWYKIKTDGLVGWIVSKKAEII